MKLVFVATSYLPKLMQMDTFYMSGQKKKKKNMKNKKNAWAFSEAPGSLLCEQPDFLSNIVPVYSL